MGRPNRFLVLSLLALLLPLAHLRAQKGDFLSQEEEDKLREAQDPSERIEIYLDLIQDRLTRFNDFRARPADPKYDNAAFTEKLLDHAIQLNDELKNWIEFQSAHQGDMRKGLRKLLAWCPKQLQELQHAQETPDAYAPTYRSTLRDAIDDLNDTLDGATKVLAEQEKKFGELKRQEKEEKQISRQRAKEEKRQTKKEEKLRKAQRRKGVPADSEEN
jgi:hypothetical protein